jgi:4-amino-4-deoxy-L-arabinose transferase-like glycosyltransferase
MNLVQVRELVNKYHIPQFTETYHKLLLLGALLLVFVIDAFVISQRPLHLSEGVSSTWWLIIQNVESGAGYKACETHYIPNCDTTDQTTAMREPIPVIFYVLVGKLTQNSSVAFQFSQLLFNLLMCLFMYRLTSELGNPTLGLIAAYGWAFYLPAVHTLLHISGDLMAGFFVLSGILSMTWAIKKGSLKSWLLFGVLFGLAALSRSSTVLIFIILAAGSVVYAWLSATLHRGWYRPLLAIIMFGLVVSPWMIRNQIVFGKPILATTLVGYNLYRFNAIASSEVPAHYVGPDEGYAEVQALVARVPELRRPISEGQVDAIFEREALKIIRNHLEEYIELVAFRPFPLWFNLGIPDQYGEQMGLTDYLVVIQQGILLVTFMMAIWKGNWYMRLLAASVLFFMLGYLAVDAQLRYMIVVMPLVISISVIGLARYIQAQIRGKQPRQYSGIIPRYE